VDRRPLAALPAAGLVRSSPAVDWRAVPSRGRLSVVLAAAGGPEFIARAIRDWLPRSGVQTLYIAPGAPWESAYSG